MTEPGVFHRELHHENDAKVEADAYLLGTGDAEIARLAFQHRAWGAQAYSLWERAGFQRGATLLDLGCGPGFATVDLAHLVGPKGRVVAADASPRYLAHLRRAAAFQGLDWVTAVETDATRLDLGSRTGGGDGTASFDGAYCRWMLCYLKAPEEAIAGVARYLTPGGRFAVTDYFNYRSFTVAPPSAAFTAVVAGVGEMFRRNGGDLEIGGHLPALLRDAGLEPLEVRQVTRTTRPGSPLWAWPETFFTGFLPRLVAEGLVDEATADAFWDDWRQRAADPDAFLSLPPQVEIVAEKR